MLTPLAVSVTRTWAALAAGFLITWGVNQGLGLDTSLTSPLTEVLTTAFTAGWYLAVRVAEHYVPQAGWLLLVAAKPDYPAVTAAKTPAHAAPAASVPRQGGEPPVNG
jgi:hypothetical protein